MPRPKPSSHCGCAAACGRGGAGPAAGISCDSGPDATCPLLQAPGQSRVGLLVREPRQVCRERAVTHSWHRCVRGRAGRTEHTHLISCAAMGWGEGVPMNAGEAVPPAKLRRTSHAAARSPRVRTESALRPRAAGAAASAHHFRGEGRGVSD